MRSSLAEPFGRVRRAKAAPPPPPPPPLGMSDWGGATLRRTLVFLLWPLALLVVIKLVYASTGVKLPPLVLYVFALVYGAFLLKRIFNDDPDALIGLYCVYLPFSAIIKVSIIPGVNGTYMLLALGLLALAVHRQRTGTPMFQPRPGTRVMGWWWFLSGVSMITAMVHLGAPHAVFRFSDYKSWLDQFFIFFVFINLIRDGRMARRASMYMLLGTLFVMALGFEEWIDKRDASSLDKARLLGPQNQPNSFGAFLVYAVGPIMALLLVHMTNWRSWGLVPVLLVWARLLIASFSRGAYLGFAAAAVALGYARGKVFVACAAAALVGLVVAVPEVVPESIQNRLGISAQQDEFTTPQIDTSSQHRLILWNAAIDMTLEQPVFGFGFGSFPVLKGFYTESDVHETDNHNMYLYVSSQMGLPALVVMLLVLGRLGWLGLKLARQAPEATARALGMGACATVAGALVVNMFGSRLGDLSVMAYVWFQLAVVSHLTVEMRAGEEAARRAAQSERKRGGPRMAPQGRRIGAGNGQPAREGAPHG